MPRLVQPRDPIVLSYASAPGAPVTRLELAQVATFDRPSRRLVSSSGKMANLYYSLAPAHGNIDGGSGYVNVWEYDRAAEAEEYFVDSTRDAKAFKGYLKQMLRRLGIDHPFSTIGRQLSSPQANGEITGMSVDLGTVGGMPVCALMVNDVTVPFDPATARDILLR